MGLVRMGKKWDIKTKEDFDAAMEELKDNEMCAEMSDDFMCWKNEKYEVSCQRADVIRQAKALGIIKEEEK